MTYSARTYAQPEIEADIISHRFLDENPPTDQHATLPDTAHSIASSSLSATDSLYNAAAKFGSAVSNVASTAGAWVASKTGPANPSNSHTLDNVADAYDTSTSGIAEGSIELKDAVAESTGRVVENEWGSEVREVGGNLAESAGNVTGGMGQAMKAVSGIAVVGEGVQGAAEAQDDDQEQGWGSEDKKDRKGERQISGQWEDVPV